jgi:bis(5'-nucleosidyl)-tetraphosphatase
MELAAKVLSAGVVVVRREAEGWVYLLLRVYNYWDFPKGEVRPGEDPLQTAQREVAEEAGLKDLSFFWGHVYRETPPYGRGKIARYYVAQTREKDIELPISTGLKDSASEGRDSPCGVKLFTPQGEGKGE